VNAQRFGGEVMNRSIQRRRLVVFAALAAAAVVLLAPLPAAAEVYHVKLVSGDEFETRYQPVETSWDSNQLLLITEVGNWIALSKEDVEGVTTETETKGYGRVINTTTIMLGSSSGDAEDETKEKTEVSPMDALREMLNRPQPNYSVEQFVEPSEAGGGLPVGYGLGYVPTGAPANP
jgi:hypothetical protein